MISVQEAIDRLQEVEDKTIPMVIEADHENTLMTATGMGLIEVEEMDDGTEYEGQVFVIEAY